MPGPRRAINPATPVEPYADLVPELDMLLLMTVEPGFGGQGFLDLVLPKIRRARELIGGWDSSVWVQVDGGVTTDTIGRCAEEPAQDVFIARARRCTTRRTRPPRSARCARWPNGPPPS